MRRLATVLAIVAALSLPGFARNPWVVRVEGEALSAQPDYPTTAQTLTIECSDPADASTPVLIRGLAQNRSWIEERATGSTVLSFLRVNRAYWGNDSGPVGTVTIKSGTKVLAVIEPGKPSAFDCKFSIGPGRAEVVLLDVTPGVTIYHRAGNSPNAIKVVESGDQAAGQGDYWCEGPPGTFAQFELVR